MNITRSITQEPTKLLEGISRNITSFDSAVSGYIQIPAITFAGDFSVEVKFVTRSGGVNFPTIWGGVDSALGLWVYLDQTTNSINIRSDDGLGQTFTSISNANVKDNKVHTVVCSFVSGTNTYSISLDGGTPVTNVDAGVANDFKYIGVNNFTGVLGNYSDKEIYDVKTWQNSTQSGAPDHHFPLDEDFATATIAHDTGEINSPTRGEMYVLNDFDNAAWSVTNVTLASDGTVTQLGQFGRARQFVGAIEGLKYIVTGEIKWISGNTALHMGTLGGGDNTQTAITVTGTFQTFSHTSTVLTSDTSAFEGFFHDRNAAGFGSYQIRNISVKPVHNGGFGADPVLNGGFGADTDWVKGAGWTIAAGVAHCDGTQIAVSNLSQNAGIAQGKTYLIKFTLLNYSAGTIKPFAGGTAAGTIRSANGTFTDLITSTDATINIFLQGDVNFIGDIDNVSVQEIAQPNNLTSATQRYWLKDHRNYNKDVVVNGGFDADTDWTKGVGWTIAAGVGTGLITSAQLEQPETTFGDGKSYLVTFTTSNVSAGDVRVFLYGPDNVAVGLQRSTNGTFTEIITIDTVTGSAPNRIVFSGNVFTGNVDNVSVLDLTNFQRWENEFYPNLLTESSSFDHADWVKTRCTQSANQITAPDGTLTGDEWNPDITNSTHVTHKGVLPAGFLKANTMHTFYIYAKTGLVYDWLVLKTFDPAGQTYFDCTNGVIGAVGAKHTAHMLFVGDGWYKCSIVFDSESALLNQIQFGAVAADATDSYIGIITQGIYTWGAQLEIGTTPTRLRNTTQVIGKGLEII